MVAMTVKAILANEDFIGGAAEVVPPAVVKVVYILFLIGVVISGCYLFAGMIKVFFDGVSLSNTYYIPVLKNGHKVKTKRLKIKYPGTDKMMEQLEKKVLKPIQKAWMFTQNKEATYYQEYVSTYQGVTLYLEEIVESVNSWTEIFNKALEDNDTEEIARLKGVLDDQLKGSLGVAIDYISNQMQSIRKKELQYEEDIKEAENTLSKESPVHQSEDTPFETLDVLMAAEREQSDLLKKYEEKQPKKKKTKKKKNQGC